MDRLSYKLLLIFTVLATLGGILTLIPWEGASYPNLINYPSLCTFTPAATAYCFLLAGLSCFVRATFIKDQSGSRSERFKKHRRSLIPLIALLVLAVFFNFRYLSIKASYADTATAASVEIP